MNGIILLIIGAIFVLIALAAILVFKRKNKRLARASGSVRARCILTINEQPTYLRLKKALPEHFILTQVSHAALLSCTAPATRLKSLQCRADFVVLDNKFKVVAIIDLDDASHKATSNRNLNRNLLLQQAGYKIITYTSTPDIEVIKADFHTAVPSFPDMYAEYYDDL
jgi:very-short-patch-repair endonuclease